MKKIINEYLNETYYKDILDNGLEVIIFHKPEFSMTSCAIGTPFGGLALKEELNNKIYEFNAGTAHFLEHKLFEDEDNDVMNKFSALGANVNAATSYEDTIYYFEKTGEDIDDCLNLLLDFVQELNISKESVDKEKDIIIKEIDMYNDRINSRLVLETFKSLYHKYPLRNDVGGTRESVRNITKEELELAHNINYNPSNMILSIVSPIDPKHIIEVIKENQNKKEFKINDKPRIIFDREDEEVNRKSYSFNMPTSIDKHVKAYKLNIKFDSAYDRLYKEWCLKFLFKTKFSYLNPKYQEWLDKGMVNDYFGYEFEFGENASYIMIYNENDDENILEELIEDGFNNFPITEDILKQLKRRYIGASLGILDNIANFNLSYLRSYLKGEDVFEVIEILKNIKLEDVNKMWKSLDLSKTAKISIKK